MPTERDGADLTNMARIVNDDSFERVLSFLKKVDTCFGPPLRSCVDLNAYALKLSNKGVNLYISIDGVDIGHAAFYANDVNKGFAFLSSICVVGNFRGLGLGEKLLEQVKIIAAKRGMKKLSLKVKSSNEVAIAFYVKHGFVISGAYGLDSHLMDVLLDGCW